MKKLLILTLMMALALTLTFTLSGCSGEVNELDGKNIVTFDVNGGILNYGTSSTKTSVKFAYYPGTYLLDPAEDIHNYSLSRSGYDFTGWYTDKDCTASSKWDFDTPFEQSELTLYAGWEKSIRHTYSIYYVDENSETAVKLGEYDALAGETFSDYREYAYTREGYTCTGYYSDKELTTPWDPDFTHPGGETDFDVAVYADYIEGEWNLVANYDQLKSATSGNVYLTADIDCGGKEFSVGNFSGIFNGNGHTISNFKVKKGGAASTPTSAIFKRLTETAEVKDVDFENVTFEFTEIKESTDKITVTPKAAALTVDMEAGAKVKNVTVTGTMITNYVGELPCINSVYFYDGAPDPEVMAGVEGTFSANVTVNQQ